MAEENQGYQFETEMDYEMGRYPMLRAIGNAVAGAARAVVSAGRYAVNTVRSFGAMRAVAESKLEKLNE